MANRTISIGNPLPTRSGDTIAGYNLYSDHPAANTLIGTLTPAEALAGKIINIPDGGHHDLLAKVVWTTAGESLTNDSNIVIVDLSAAQNGLKSIDTNSEYANMIFSPGSSTWEISMTLDVIDNQAGNVYFSNSTSPNTTVGAIQLKTGSGTIQLRYNSGSGNAEGALHNIANGNTVKVEYNGSALVVFINDSAVETITGTFTWAGSSLFFFAYSSALSHATCSMSAISTKIGTAATEIFVPTTQSTGATITASGGTVLNVLNNAMYYTI